MQHEQEKGDAPDLITRLKDERTRLREEIEQLRDALHAAIAAPKGVVPESAEEFYDPAHPALWRLNPEARVTGTIRDGGAYG